MGAGTGAPQGRDGAVPAVSAHRRDGDGLAGLRDAAASGAEYVEIDVRRTADGALVVHHDRTVGGVPLSRCAYPRLRALAPRPVPLVGEALRIVAGRARAHLDLKERGCEHEAVAMALEVCGAGRLVVSSREPASIALIKKAFPEVTAALSVGRGPWERGAFGDLAPLRAIRGCGADMVALNHRLARAGVLRQCARAGVPAMVWTVNAVPLMRRFLSDPRVAILVTDHPGAALRLRAAARSRKGP
jgi:glycerophosphoryl diester phosphodiesterase